MNSVQTNKLASYAALEAALKANPEVENVPGLPAKLATLSATMGEIKSLAKTQTEPLQASTAKRDQLLEEMSGMTLEIAGFVTSIAREQDMPDLARRVVVGPGFRRVRRSHRIAIAERILEAAQSVASQLTNYGVTAERLAAFQAAIKAADEGLTIPRSAVVVKKAATTKLAALFEEMDVLLRDHIDRLVFPLRKDVAFYAAYKAARAIVDRPGSPRGPREENPAVSATAPSPSAATTVEQQHAA